MIPAGFTGVETQLWLWMLAMVRPGASLLVAPLFGSATVPVQLRVIVALAIGVAAVDGGFVALPDDGPVSVAALLLVAGEVVLGAALGLAVQIGYAAASVAGELIGNAMGLGFASMIDPTTSQSNPALSQLLSMVTAFLFFTSNGHLRLIEAIFTSYAAMPPGVALPRGQMQALVEFGGAIFSAGLAIALPVGFAIVLIQLLMGFLARSSPQLNLFSVGLPAATIAGILLLAIGLPTMASTMASSLAQGLSMADRIAGQR